MALPDGQTLCATVPEMKRLLFSKDRMSRPTLMPTRDYRHAVLSVLTICYETRIPSVIAAQSGI